MPSSILILLAGVYGAAAFVCLVLPRRLQRMAAGADFNAEGRYGLIIRSWKYILVLRVIGLIYASASLLLLFSVVGHA
jgi:hypothetical protein